MAAAIVLSPFGEDSLGPLKAVEVSSVDWSFSACWSNWSAPGFNATPGGHSVGLSRPLGSAASSRDCVVSSVATSPAGFSVLSSSTTSGSNPWILVQVGVPPHPFAGTLTILVGVGLR